MPKNKFTLIIIFLLISFNIGIFFYANSLPINWTNDEILWQGAFWSESPTLDHTISTGLHHADLIKPFNIYHADGTFRTRQVSYFVEMLSFKFWQNFELIFLRNYTIILIHLVNVILGAVLIFFLTRCKKTSLISLLLLLNSGAAIASMLYPFRNAKLLVMTFFLIAWIILAKDKMKFSDYSLKRIFSFFFFILLALLTDEISLFFLPILFVYLWLQQGAKELFHKKVIFPLILTGITFSLLTAGAYYLSVHVIDSTAPTGEQTHFLKSLGSYLTKPVILKDISRAFVFYFLRRNYGYWDKTPLGILAFLSSIALMLLILLFRTNKQQRNISLSILFFIILKAFLFPHNAGYHRVFMPEGTVFPSLFFFSYYYIYAEALLFALIIALCLKNTAASNKRFIFILMLISIISLSNALHLQEGPQDALKFMRFDKGNKEKPQEMVKKIKKIKNILKDQTYLPVYLSFPVGDSAIVLAKRNDPFNNLYTRMIPFLYLKSLEKGNALTSIINIKRDPINPLGGELFPSKYFYDVLTQKLYPLHEILEQFGENAFNPIIATKNSFGTKTTMIPPKGIVSIVFFIKGRSGFLLEYRDRKIEGQQMYGEAYQMFQIDNIASEKSLKPSFARVSILPIGKNEKSFLVGPFIIPKG